MRRLFAVLGSAIFLVLAPGTVAGLVPWWISRWISGWSFDSSGICRLPARTIGAILVLAGAPVILDSFVRFAIKGLGTPAPVFPTRHLVTSGLYRRVRNPIYIAVVALIIGQGLILGNIRVLLYGALVWLFFHLFVVLYEEPTLRAAYGPEYEAFCNTIPRWVPRI